LVVIGIIAVLIAILLPALSRARSQAATTSCMATLRMIGQTLSIYAAENKDSLPYGYYRSDAVVVGAGGAVDENDTNPQLYIWWSVLRSYQRRGTNMDNGAANGQGLSSRGMKGMQCPTALGPTGGIAYVPNMLMIPDRSFETAFSIGNASNWLKPDGLKPSKFGKLYSDNILFWDAAEIPPTYGSQYVVGYYVANKEFYNGKQSYRRFRDMAANPGFIAPGSVDANETPIDPGTNKDVTPGLNGDTQLGNIRWRHGKNDSANFLFADGTVKTMKITTGTFGQPNFKGEVLLKYFRPKSPMGAKPTG
jgi:prepilin-type processing-associated H-X9-DG protein